jgi:DNA-binding transcriptional ArsR family regulator
MEKQVDLVLHPIRMRILVALSGRQMTAGEMAEEFGDVPPATLYRHINRLADGGILRVVNERRVRGTVEKVYTVTEQDTTISPRDLAKLSREGHLRIFSTFITSLLDDFSRYLKKPGPIDYVADGIGYKKYPLELSDKEFLALMTKIHAVVQRYQKNEPAAGRKRRIFSTVVMPDVHVPAKRAQRTK